MIIIISIVLIYTIYLKLKNIFMLYNYNYSIINVHYNYNYSIINVHEQA